MIGLGSDKKIAWSAWKIAQTLWLEVKNTEFLKNCFLFRKQNRPEAILGGGLQCIGLLSNFTAALCCSAFGWALVLVHLFVGTKGWYLSYFVNKSTFSFVVNWKLNWTLCTSWVRKAALVVKLVVDQDHYCRATLPGWSLVSLLPFGLHRCSSVNAVLSASLLNVGAVPSLVS